MVVDAKSLKDMVGPCGLEPQTSTVSKATGTRTSNNFESVEEHLSTWKHG